MDSTERLMTLTDLSEMLGIPINTLYRWRVRGEGQAGMSAIAGRRSMPGWKLRPTSTRSDAKPTMEALRCWPETAAGTVGTPLVLIKGRTPPGQPARVLASLRAAPAAAPNPRGFKGKHCFIEASRWPSLEPGLALLRLAQGRADEVAAIRAALDHATEDFEREVG